MSLLQTKNHINYTIINDIRFYFTNIIFFGFIFIIIIDKTKKFTISNFIYIYSSELEFGQLMQIK